MGKDMLDKRLLFVMGKGGVGKSTLALALALHATRSGKRTIVAEMTGDDRLQRAFGAPGGRRFEEVDLAPGLATISIEPMRAMEEYLSFKVPPPFNRALRASSLFQTFAMATPGMSELLCLGKVWELAQPQRHTEDGEPYDLVIVDAPATGHGVGVLKAPRTFAEIARVGPVASQATTIDATLHDPAFTGLLAVCTPEEMPVNETLGLLEVLQRERLQLDAVLLNACYPQRFTDAEAARLDDVSADPAAPAPAAAAAARAALSEHARAAAQTEQVRRLRAAVAAPLVTLPFLFAETFAHAQIETLADRLAEVLPA